MSNLWGREPAVVLGLIQAGLAMALTFGMSMSGDQIGAIMAFAAVLIAVITRTQVTPVGKLPEVVVGVEQEDGEITPAVLKAEEK